MTKTGLSNNTVHIYVIDDDLVFRQRLITVFNNQGYITCAFDKVADFLNWIDYENLPPQACIFAEVNLPELTGLDLLHVLLADEITLPTVLMSAQASIKTVVKAMLMGADHYIEKNVEEHEFLILLGNLMSGSNHLTSNEPCEIKQRFGLLSDRQKQIFLSVFRGETNKHIADQLKISIKTVELHRAQLMRNMQAASLAELIQMAVLINKTSNRFLFR